MENSIFDYFVQRSYLYSHHSPISAFVKSVEVGEPPQLILAPREEDSASFAIQHDYAAWDFDQYITKWESFFRSSLMKCVCVK